MASLVNIETTQKRSGNKYRYNSKVRNHTDNRIKSGKKLDKSTYINFGSLLKKTRYGLSHSRFFVVFAEEPSKLYWYESYAKFLNGSKPKSMEMLKYAKISPRSFSVTSLKKKIVLSARTKQQAEKWTKTIFSAIYAIQKNKEISLQRALSEDASDDDTLSRQESIEIGFEVFDTDISNLSFENSNVAERTTLQRQTSISMGKKILNKALSIDSFDSNDDNDCDVEEDCDVMNIGRKDSHGDIEEDDKDNIMNSKNIAVDILSRLSSACSAIEMYDALNYGINAMKVADISSKVKNNFVINSDESMTLRTILLSNVSPIICIQKHNDNWSKSVSEKYQQFSDLLEKRSMIRNFNSEFDNTGNDDSDDDDWFEQSKT
jgi:hypothetical protein